MSAQGKKATSDPTPEALAEAKQAEAVIAAKAAEIRGAATELDPELFLKLRPLLREPIPSAFIKYVPRLEKGKPYESTGVRAVQVQIDRMDNVLTPLWWFADEEYFNEGKLARVTVTVGTPEKPLFSRSSYGGVDRGSTTGNVYKGSYTNAAKPAFARVGPGYEIYLGAADLDPDVNEQIAEQASKGAGNGQPASPAEIGPGIASKLVDRAWKVPAAKEAFRLAASHAAGGKDVGDCSTKKGAVEGIAGLTYEQAEKFERWISKKETEAEVDAPAEKKGGEE